MARGWESKSVEEQMAAAEERRRARPGLPMTSADREKQSRRDGLLLSRAKLLADLEQARDPRHRAQLQQALDYIEKQLEE